MEAGNKRKRDLGCPRITFHTLGRTFERLFREDSLQELKDTVRKKLGLAPDAIVSLSQVRDGSTVDLEDEEDFDAFYNVLHSTSTASVRITVSRTAANKAYSVESGQPSKQKKQKLDSAAQLSSVQPSSNENLPPVAIVSVPASKKRAVSFAQSEANKVAEGRQANEPPAKRPKTISTGAQQPDSSPRSSTPPRTEPLQHADDTTGVDSAVEKQVTSQSAESPAPKPSSITPAQAVEVDGSKFTKQKRKKASASQISAEPEDAVRGRSTAKRLLDGQRKSEATQSKQPTVEVNPKLSKSRPAATVPNSPPLPEDGLKDTKPKKKTSAPTKTSQTDTPATEPPKKTPRSKSKVRESTSAVDSETSDKVFPPSDPLLADSLATISRRMIEKYLTPSSSNTHMDNVETGDDEFAEIRAVDISQRMSNEDITSPPTSLSKPKCPYCCKPLTHDRSHCPLIRSKEPELVEKRIAVLEQNAAEDVDSNRENVIEVLQSALLRIRGAKAKKGTTSNVPSSAKVPITESASAKPCAKITTASSVKKFSRAPRRSTSASSANSSNEDSPPRKSAPAPRLLPSSGSGGSLDNDDDFQEFDPLGRPMKASSSQDLHISSVAQQNHRTPSQPTVASPSPTDDSSGTESSSEDETLQVVDVASQFEKSSSSSDSFSEDELTTSLKSLKNRIQLQPQPFNLLSKGVSGNAEKELEALIRGPGVPLKSAELPSSEESDEYEGHDDVQLVSESEEEPRDRSQRMQSSYSSSDDSEDEEMNEMGNNLDEIFNTPSRKSMSPLARRSGPTSLDNGDEVDEVLHLAPVLISRPLQPTQEPAFQKINGRLRSVETDRTGNEAFEQALREENAVFDLAMRLTPSLASKQTSPGLAEKSRHTSPALDANVDGQEYDSESIKAQAKGSNEPANRAPEVVVEEEAEPVRAAIPDPVESSEVARLCQRSSDDTAADEEAPFVPPLGQPREEPERASTPKPGLVQRMRNRIGSASPLSSNYRTSNSTVRSTVKPRMVRAASLRSQQGPKTRGHDTELTHEIDDLNVAGDTATPGASTKLSAPKKGASSTTRSISTRAKASTENKVEKAEESTEEPDPPPRRTTRAASKAAAANPKITIASLLTDLQPLSRRTRQTKTTAVNDGILESSQSFKKKSTKETKLKKGEAKEAAKSPITPPTSEDTEVDAQESQAANQAVLSPPSPSVSLNAWEVMPPDTPIGTTQSDGVDELQTDVEPLALKPQFRRKSEFLGRKRHPVQSIHDPEERGKGQGDEKDKPPLFVPSESQTAFPHSQFQTQEHDPVESDSSDSEAEVRAAVVKRPSTQAPQTPRYRKLSDITLQATRWLTTEVRKHRKSTGLLQPTSSAPAKRQDRLNKLYGTVGRKNDDDDSDDDSEQGSDSDEEKLSHIPRARRAGAGLRGRMSVG